MSEPLPDADALREELARMEQAEPNGASESSKLKQLLVRRAADGMDQAQRRGRAC
jgi:hypothetical protein